MMKPNAPDLMTCDSCLPTSYTFLYTICRALHCIWNNSQRMCL